MLFFNIKLDVMPKDRLYPHWEARNYTKEELDNDNLYQYNEKLGSYYELSEEYHAEKAVEAHYNWILSVAMHNLKDENLPIQIDHFLTKQQIKELEEQQEKYEELIKTYKFKGNVGDIALVVDQNEKLHVIALDRQGVTFEHPYAGFELKKDLEVGKVRIDKITEEGVLSILKSKEFADMKEQKLIKDKAGLLQVLEQRKGS